MHCKCQFLEFVFSQLVQRKKYSSNSFKFLDMFHCPKVTCILKIELVAHVERFMEFVKLCCSVEGDGELSFLVAGHLEKMCEVYPHRHELHIVPSVSLLDLDAV